VVSGCVPRGKRRVDQAEAREALRLWFGPDYTPEGAQRMVAVVRELRLRTRVVSVAEKRRRATSRWLRGAETTGWIFYHGGTDWGISIDGRLLLPNFTSSSTLNDGMTSVSTLAWREASPEEFSQKWDKAVELMIESIRVMDQFQRT
jgi:hypothetical protein